MRKVYNIVIGDVVRQYTVIDKFSRKNSTILKVVCQKCGHTFEREQYKLFDTGIGCKRCIADSLRKPTSHKRLRNLHSKMIFRVNNTHLHKNKAYIGITVCDEWLGDNGVYSFIQWSLDNGYAEGLSIDRKNNELGYSPDNCRWVDAVVQSQNRRKTCNNTTGYKGVYLSKPRNGVKLYTNTGKFPYYTIIIYKSKRVYLTGYATALEAYQARVEYIKNNQLEGLVIL